MTKILGVIPARYASTRFPAKPLVNIEGKSMIRRVYEQAAKSTRLAAVVIATDHADIFDHALSFGNVVMTRSDHPSGTDRCFEALQQQVDEYDYVINVQGDEPFIQPTQIDLLARLLDGTRQLATLIKPIHTPEPVLNPNVVKVVVSTAGEALYFSRSAIPYIRNTTPADWHTRHIFYKHIGMYAYRTDVLGEITKLPVSSLETAESLEQLRWLENGYRIHTAITHDETIGIDTPDDLPRAVAFARTAHLL